MDEERIYWQIPQRVLYIKALHNASIELVHDEIEIILTLFDEGTAPLHLIFDVVDIGLMPAVTTMTDELLKLFSHPALGRTVVIGFRQQDMPILESARDALSQVTGKPIDFTNSIEETMALLKKYDPSLDV